MSLPACYTVDELLDHLDTNASKYKKQLYLNLVSFALLFALRANMISCFQYVAWVTKVVTSLNFSFWENSMDFGCTFFLINKRVSNFNLMNEMSKLNRGYLKETYKVMWREDICFVTSMLARKKKTSNGRSCIVNIDFCHLCFLLSTGHGSETKTTQITRAIIPL